MSESYDMTEYAEQLDNPSSEGSDLAQENSTDISTDNVETQPESDEGESLEDQLKAFNGESEDQPPSDENGEEQASKILDLVSDLGILRKGLPVEIENEEQLKELISKGYDYTVKTQEASAELEQGREQLQSEIAQANEQIESKMAEADEILQNNQQMVTNNQVITDVVAELQASDPDLFEELDRRFTEKLNAYNAYQHNPAYQKLTQQNSELSERLNAIEGGNETKEYENIRSEWESGYADVSKELGNQLKTIGIKADWKTIHNKWKADESGTMTVKEALFAVHGDKITNALQAKARLASKKAKVSNLTDSGNANSEQSSKPKPNSYIDPYTNMDYLNSIASRHGV